MKIEPRDIDRFLAAPNKNLDGLLVYGSDPGLVAERMALFIKSFGNNDVVTLQLDEIKNDPRRLFDEVSSISLFGGNNIVRLLGMEDASQAIIQQLIELVDNYPKGNFLLINGGDQKKTSPMVRLFEQAPNVAAIACYVEDAAAIAQIYRKQLSEAGLRLSRDADAYLASMLGGNRLVMRSEIDKLICYIGQQTQEITLDQVMEAVGDSAALTVDDIPRAALGGRGAELLRLLKRAEGEEINSVALIRGAQRHLQRLHQLRCLMEEERMTIDQALGQIKPPLFFKIKDDVKAQTQRWGRAALEDLLRECLAIEAACKKTNAPDRLLVERFLMKIAASQKRAAA